MQQVDINLLLSETDNLVTNYSPRNHEFNQIYINNNCDLGPTTFNKNNLIRALEDVRSKFADLGYGVSLETVPEKYGGGYNIVAIKPSLIRQTSSKIIDIGAHLDAWKSWTSDASTPGASDNAVSVAGLITMATILKEYPNRHPWQFVVFVSEERGRNGSKIHADLMKNQPFSKALILDGIGWSEIAPEYMNCNWAFDDIPQSAAMAGLFDQVHNQYDLPINWRRCSSTTQTSDHVSYYEKGLPSILSIGGFPYGGANYHSCEDNMINLDIWNAYYTLQENVGVLLNIDKEP